MITELFPPGALILCAVSGGADSTFLLRRLHELGYPVAAAHYNHGLRGEYADRDENFVRQMCRSLSVPFLSERGDAAAYATLHRMGVEEAARALRYDFLERAADALGAAVIATGHTADDNAETVLMHLARGAGLHGLGGIPPVRGRILRPMLDTTHDEALAYLAARGIPHMEDETNEASDAARNRIRHTVMPALRDENPSFSRTVLRTTELLREDEAFLAGLAEAFVLENRIGNSLPAEALAALPRPVSLRAVRLMAGPGLTAQQARDVLHIAEAGGIADVSGMRVGVSGGRVYFGVGARPPLPERALVPGQALCLPEAGMRVVCEKTDTCPEDVYKSLNIFYFKCENICGNISVGARRSGDKYRPAGRGMTKSLKQLFSEAGVPRWERDAIPVLRDEAGVIGVRGFPPAERVCARPGDAGVMKVSFIQTD